MQRYRRGVQIIKRSCGSSRSELSKDVQHNEETRRVHCLSLQIYTEMNIEELIERITSVLFALIALMSLGLTYAHYQDPFAPYVTGLITLIGCVACWSTWKTKNN